MLNKDINAPFKVTLHFVHADADSERIGSIHPQFHSHALCVANLHLIEFAPEVYETKYSLSESQSYLTLERDKMM